MNSENAARISVHLDTLDWRRQDYVSFSFDSSAYTPAVHLAIRPVFSSELDPHDHWALINCLLRMHHTPLKQLTFGKSKGDTKKVLKNTQLTSEFLLKWCQHIISASYELNHFLNVIHCSPLYHTFLYPFTPLASKKKCTPPAEKRQ
jgi:hypothetical protein